MGITCLVARSDGSLLSGSIDKTMKLWDLNSGLTLMSFDRHGGGIFSMTLEEVQPSAYLVSGGADGRVRFWDFQRHRGMFQVIVGEDMYPIAVDFEFARPE
jgi:WD40 repeat protein